jgi:hypothetical protein
VADLAGLASGNVELLLTGPTHLVTFVEELLTVPDVPVFEVAESPRPTAAELIQRLRSDTARPAKPVTEHVCAQCGGRVGPAARYCGACGAAVVH